MNETLFTALDSDNPLSHPVNSDLVTETLATMDDSPNIFETVAYGVPLVVTSTVAAAWNSVATIGNIVTPMADPFGKLEGDFALPFDNYQKFYSQHKEGLDFTGEVITSFVPGTAGVKALHWAQKAGRVSESAAGGLGLLTNQATDYYLAKAASAINVGDSPTKFIAASAAAKGSQFGLEAMAGQVATYAAMSESSLFEDVDSVGGFLSNVATTGVIFGGIGTGWGALTARGSKFASAGLGGAKTTINEVEELVSKARSTASYFEKRPFWAGREFTEDAVSASTGKTEQVAKQFTAGDDVLSSFRNELKPIVNPYKAGTKEFDDLAGRLAADREAAKSSLASYRTEALDRLVADPSLVSVVSDSIVGLPPLTRDKALSAATKIQRATVAGGRNKNVTYLDLATGEVNQKAQVLAADLGDIKVKNNSISYGTKQFTMTKTDLPTLVSRTVDEHNVAYHFQDEVMKARKDVAITDIPTVAVAATDLPKMEALYKYHKGFAIDGELFLGEEALTKLESVKREAFDELLKKDPTMGYAELKARLNVSDTFLLGGAIKSPEGNLFGATDFTKPSKVEVLYNTASRPTNFWATKGETFQDLRIRAMQEANTLVATKLFNRDLPDIDFKALGGKEQLADGLTFANPNFRSTQELVSFGGGLSQKLTVDKAVARQGAMVNVDQTLLKAGAKSALLTEVASIKRLITSSERKLYLSGNDIVDIDKVVIATIGSKEAADWLAAAHKIQSSLARDKLLAHKAMGKSTFDPDALYFPPPHPDDVKFRAFIKDTNGGTGMVYAGTQKVLAEKIRQVERNFPDYRIFQEAEVAAYHKLKGDYEQALDTRGYLRIDTSLKNRGILSDPIPTTNPSDFIADFHAGLARQEKDLVHSAIQLRYGQQLAEASAAASILRKPTGDAAKIYNTLTNTMDTASQWAKVQRGVVGAVDGLMEEGWNTIQAMKSGKAGIDQLEAIDIANRYGVDAFASKELWDLSGMKTWTGATTKAVRETNSMIRFLQLGIDSINAVVQVVGFPILAVPVFKNALREGTDVTGWSKTMHKGMREIISKDTKDEILKRAVKDGVVPEDMFQYQDLFDIHAQVVGSKSSTEAFKQATDLKGKIFRFVEKLETPTALAERFTALYAYRLGEMAYDATAKGAATELGRSAYASNFARKTLGNFVMAQRPLAYQGTLGAAVGLFQTYQGTYFQQAARLASAPQGKKDLAMLAAMQGTLFGAQSLPAFDLANKALFQQWNDEKRDVRTALSNTTDIPVLGELGDAVLYGSLSSALGSALWTRGDVNPRLPMGGAPWNLENLTQYQYTSKIIGAMGQWWDSVSNGGAIGMSSAEAIAHANLSRPLTGIAEVLSGVRTTQGGQLATSLEGDLLSLSTVMRIAGAKPFHEAIAVNETYKAGVVKAKEQKELNDVAYALRSRLLGEPNEALDQEVITEFAKRYSEAGGNPQGFNKWYMANLSKASTPRAQEFAKQVARNPWAQSYLDLAGIENLKGQTAPSKDEVKAAIKEYGEVPKVSP